MHRCGMATCSTSATVRPAEPQLSRSRTLPLAQTPSNRSTRAITSTAMMTRTSIHHSTARNMRPHISRSSRSTRAPPSSPSSFFPVHALNDRPQDEPREKNCQPDERSKLGRDHERDQRRPNKPCDHWCRSHCPSGTAPPATCRKPLHGTRRCHLKPFALTRRQPFRRNVPNHFNGTWRHT